MTVGHLVHAAYLTAFGFLTGRCQPSIDICRARASVRALPGASLTIVLPPPIVEEAPGNALTLARARQMSIEGWQRPVKKPKAVK